MPTFARFLIAKSAFAAAEAANHPIGVNIFMILLLVMANIAWVGLSATGKPQPNYLINSCDFVRFEFSKIFSIEKNKFNKI